MDSRAGQYVCVFKGWHNGRKAPDWNNFDGHVTKCAKGATRCRASSLMLIGVPPSGGPG